MLLEKINSDEISFLESWFTPLCLAECVFSDLNNFGKFEEDAFSEIRLYQLSMMSDEPLVDFEETARYHKLSEKETFQLRKNVADCYNFGGRLYGKSLISLKLDIMLSSLYDDNEDSLFYSIDEKRLRGILDSVRQAFEYHPIFRIFEFVYTYKPEIKFYGKKNGWSLRGVNMTLKGKAPGEQFYQLHVKKMWGDEESFETETVYKKRRDSVSELGSIFRLAGMTNYTRHSPAGKIFYSPENRKNIINYPRYVNPYWTEKDKQDALEEFGGKESPAYKIFVEGEIIEDGVSEFDIERVKKCYQSKKQIKRFELKKEQFKYFESLIVVERPKNAESMMINADIGESAGTDIVIHSKVGDKYNYLYNIILYGYTRKEQEKVFKWLINKTQAEVTGLDCGDAMGRNLADGLEELYGKERVIRYAGASKIKVGFEKDEAGKVILKNGTPTYRQEYMSEWSVNRLKYLLYEEKVNIPMDYKFTEEINSVISTTSGQRKVYACLATCGDHLFDAWRVFAITEWITNGMIHNYTMKPINYGTGISTRI